MYVHKLDGRVDAAFFERISTEWRTEQECCQREIHRHQSAEQSYMNEGVQPLELARNAQALFERWEPRERRRLLKFVLSNCAWEEPLPLQRERRLTKGPIRQKLRFS